MDDIATMLPYMYKLSSAITFKEYLFVGHLLIVIRIIRGNTLCHSNGIIDVTTCDTYLLITYVIIIIHYIPTNIS